MATIFAQVKDKFNHFLEYQSPVSGENKGFAFVIRNGMVTLIPVLLIGSFALVARYFPIDAYQQFCTHWCGGIIGTILEYLFNSTFGILSLLMTMSISSCYIKQFGDNKSNELIGVITSVICFVITIGLFGDKFNKNLLGSQGVTSAIITSVFSCYFYRKMTVSERFKIRIFSDGSDKYLNIAISSTLPATIIIICCATLNYIVMKVFKVECAHQIFMKCADWIFSGMGRGYFNGVLFVFLSNLLWFLGIHGGNVLDNVANNLFQSGIAVNVAAVNSGAVPTEIVTKTFMDTFVLMGGCGSTICLLVALSLFSKRSNARGLVKIASVPMLFNINEIMVFGLPIIYNRFFLIPFITTPLVLYTIAYLATFSGLVPVICKEVTWTMPIFFSGYLSTGSVWGIVVQLINLAVGVLIYLPFIKKYDKAKDDESQFYINDLVRILKESEASTIPVTLTELPNNTGVVAKTLANDLKIALEKRQLMMYYQPQFNREGKLVSAESLLRWKHPSFGMMYPPLVVKLAGEAGVKIQLEKMIFDVVASKIKKLQAMFGPEFHSSVNVTVSTLQSNGFEMFLKDLINRYDLKPGDIMIEITEEMNLEVNKTTENLIERIRNLGFTFALDDFSMGHTSLKYLQSNQFDEVKLDGSMVQSITDNINMKEIINSIIYLSKSMGFSVIAEYVETEEQRQVLESLGCFEYQGYLYSSAIALDDLIEKFKN